MTVRPVGRFSSNEWSGGAKFKALERGWCLGGEDFRQELLGIRPSSFIPGWFFRPTQVGVRAGELLRRTGYAITYTHEKTASRLLWFNGTCLPPATPTYDMITVTDIIRRLVLPLLSLRRQRFHHGLYPRLPRHPGLEATMNLDFPGGDS
jgi:hypothetical protein